MCAALEDVLVGASGVKERERPESPEQRDRQADTHRERDCGCIMGGKHHRQASNVNPNLNTNWVGYPGTQRV